MLDSSKEEAVLLKGIYARLDVSPVKDATWRGLRHVVSNLSTVTVDPILDNRNIYSYFLIAS